MSTAAWLADLPRVAGRHYSTRGLDPDAEGLQRALGWPVGQVSDWTLPTEPGGRWHVQKTLDSWYVAHWDQWDPGTDPVKHLVFETPLLIVLAAAASTVAVAMSVARLCSARN